MGIKLDFSAFIKKKAQHYSQNILPSWCVFVFDISVVFTGFFLAYLLRFNFAFEQLSQYNLLDQSLIIASIYGFCIWVFKAYHGIIRHTSLDDIVKVLKTNTIALSILLAATYVSRFYNFGLIGSIPLSVILIHYIFTYFVLIIVRVLVKTIFYNLMKSHRKTKRQNIVIYGAGASGILTHKALSQDGKVNYHVIAFIDDNQGKRNKMLEGVRVYSPKDVLNPDFIAKYDVDSIVLSIQSMNKELRKSIIERCLELHIEVKSVPPIKKWIHGQLSSGQIKKVNIEDLLERDPIKMDCTYVAENLTGKVVMITGAAGSIGSGIVKQALTFRPKQLILLDHAESDLYDLQSQILGSTELSQYAHLIKPVIASIKDRYRLDQIFDRNRPEIIFHAAAYKHVPLMEGNPYEAILVNVFGTKALVDLSVKYQVKKFVMVSTDKAVNPTNVMGASKRIAEIYAQSIRNEKTQFITTRFGNVLGSNGSVVPLFHKQIEKKGPVTLTHKDITRYFMTIPEACSLVLEAGAMGNGGEIYVFDMGKPVKIYDLAMKMIQLSGFEVGKDIEIKEVGLRPGEKLYEELLNNEENTLPTHHPKIMRAKVRVYKHSVIEAHLIDLASIILENDDFGLVRKMKQIVPEFISNNSIYNFLDTEKENQNIAS
jgi:FlaA1/EpsC-like NDP-sugar epimerase